MLRIKVVQMGLAGCKLIELEAEKNLEEAWGLDGKLQNV